MRPALEHPNVTLLTNARALTLETNDAGTEVTEVVVEVGDGTERFKGDVVVARLRRRQHGQAPARVGQRPPSERPRQRLRPGRAQLHVPRQPGRARTLARGEPDGVPEDARAERLLLRLGRLRVPAGQHPDGREVAVADVPRREAGRDAPRSRMDARPGRASTRSTSGSRRRTCRARTTGSRWPPTATSGSTYSETNAEARKRLYEKLKSLLAKLDMNEGHLFHRFAYMKNEIPVAGVAHQAGTGRFGADPALSVLDTDCRAHELDNLYVVDTSVFPSIGAVNPALTAMANSLRVGDHLLGRLAASGRRRHPSREPQCRECAGVAVRPPPAPRSRSPTATSAPSSSRSAAACAPTRRADGSCSTPIPPKAGSTSGRGQVLIPWPNRIEDGVYEFDGRRHQLPLDEVAARNAIHGLVRWAGWTRARARGEPGGARAGPPPTPGYPSRSSSRSSTRSRKTGLSVSDHRHERRPGSLPVRLRLPSRT